MNRVAPSWSGSRPFVGRVAVREALLRKLDRATEEGGRALFLLGRTGSGQTALLAMFQEEALRRHRELRAQYVDCAYSGTRTWFELAEIFTRRHRLKGSARKLAIAWLEAVPVVGDLLLAIASTIQAIRTGRTDRSRKEVPGSARATALAAVRQLLRYGGLEPRLFLMDSLERGDSEDLAGASALIRRLSETRTLFLAAVRTKDGRPPDAIEDLILEAERLGRADRFELEPLSVSEIEEAVSRATRGPLPPGWLAWLAAETEGLPAALWSALGMLQDKGWLRKAGRRWEWADAPPERAAMVPGREWELSDRDRRLLTLAACEGQIFHCAVLAELADVSELELEDRLAALARQGLLEYRGAPSLREEITSQYAFRKAAHAEYFAACAPEAERAELDVRIRRIQEKLGL